MTEGGKLNNVKWVQMKQKQKGLLDDKILNIFRKLNKEHVCVSSQSRVGLLSLLQCVCSFTEAEIFRFPELLAYLTSCRCAMLTFYSALRLKSRCYSTLDYTHTHTHRHAHSCRVAFGRET